MSTQGPNSPASAADNAAIGTVAWSNPTNILSSDNAYATAAVANTISHYLTATNFGFSIPVGATINGITVEWEVSTGLAAGNTFDNAARLIKGGVIQATDRSNATFWTSTDTYLSHGGAADLWGTTWTVNQVNAVNFGAVLSVTTDAIGSSIAQVDHCRITIDYTTVGGDTLWAQSCV